MLNKNRLSYFILGLGIGIILTSTINSFNPKIKYEEYSEKEIIEVATDLGMVFVKDSIGIDEEKDLEEKEIEKVEAQEEIILVVKDGDDSGKVFNKLYELGVIPDKKDFSNYARKRDVEDKIRVGTYKLDRNMNYDEIISIITKSF
mgnify:FL=1